MSTFDTLYDALTIKAQTVNRDVTREIVEDWVGTAGSYALQEENLPFRRQGHK